MHIGEIHIAHITNHTEAIQSRFEDDTKAVEIAQNNAGIVQTHAWIVQRKRGAGAATVQTKRKYNSRNAEWRIGIVQKIIDKS